MPQQKVYALWLHWPGAVDPVVQSQGVPTMQQNLQLLALHWVVLTFLN
jgi:hypothetical protein